MSSEGKIVEKLENIDEHLREIKESIVGKTPTLISIEEHLTRQDSAIADLSKEIGSTRRAVRRSVRNFYYSVFATITLATFLAIVFQQPDNDVSKLVCDVLLAGGIVGLLMTWLFFPKT